MNVTLALLKQIIATINVLFVKLKGRCILSLYHPPYIIYIIYSHNHIYDHGHASHCYKKLLKSLCLKPFQNFMSKQKKCPIQH